MSNVDTVEKKCNDELELIPFDLRSIWIPFITKN